MDTTGVRPLTLNNSDQQVDAEETLSQKLLLIDAMSVRDLPLGDATDHAHDGQIGVDVLTDPKPQKGSVHLVSVQTIDLLLVLDAHLWRQVTIDVRFVHLHDCQFAE